MLPPVARKCHAAYLEADQSVPASEEMNAITADLFSEAAGSEPVRLDLSGADIVLYPEFFLRREADILLATLLTNVSWKQEKIRFYGKQHEIPRLIAWYGESGKTYAYSGIRVKAEPWLPELLAVKRRIEEVGAVVFNSVLLNLYRDGSDGVAWHSDDEPELGSEPVIASVSLGQGRKFQFKHKRDPSLKYDIVLPHGSLLVMRGATQSNWVHKIPKSAKPMGQRINLTYRVIRRRIPGVM
ncbi:MAG: alpha-ketoglutarate-dependent dioxygenase AlkB family protein [Rhodanobacteraceae bacterium]